MCSIKAKVCRKRGICVTEGQNCTVGGGYVS